MFNVQSSGRCRFRDDQVGHGLKALPFEGAGESAHRMEPDDAGVQLKRVSTLMSIEKLIAAVS